MEAWAKLRRELTGVAGLVAVLGGGAQWTSWMDLDAAKATSGEVVGYFAPALGQCRIDRIAADDRCDRQLAEEREDTAQWRAQCGGQ